MMILVRFFVVDQLRAESSRNHGTRISHLKTNDGIVYFFFLIFLFIGFKIYVFCLFFK